MTYKGAVRFRSKRFREQCAGRRAREDELCTWLLRRGHSVQSMLRDGSGYGMGTREQHTNMSYRLGRQELAVFDLLLLTHDRAVERSMIPVTSTCNASP